MVEKRTKPLHMFESMEALKNFADNSQEFKNLGMEKIFKEYVPHEMKLMEKGIADKDEEYEYIHTMRFVSAIYYLTERSSTQRDRMYYQQMHAKTLSSAINRLTRLSDELPGRYTKELEKKVTVSANNAQVVKKPEIRENETRVENRKTVAHSTKGEGVLGSVIKDTSGAQSGVSNIESHRTSVTSKELKKLSEEGPFSVLVLDTRSSEEFAASRMKLQTVINIPHTIIRLGISAKMLASELEEQYQPVFEKRGDYSRIVLVDESSTEVTSNSSLSKLITLLTKWDVSVRYKNPPVILEGGYHDWLCCYPAFTTNPRYRLSENVSKPMEDLSNVHYSFPGFEEEENKPSTILSKITDTIVTTPTVPIFDRTKKPQLGARGIFGVGMRTLMENKVPLVTGASSMDKQLMNGENEENEKSIEEEAKSYNRTERRSGIPSGFSSIQIPVVTSTNESAIKMEIEEEDDKETLLNGDVKSEPNVNGEIKEEFPVTQRIKQEGRDDYGNDEQTIKEEDDDDDNGEEEVSRIPHFNRALKPITCHSRDGRTFDGFSGRGLTGLKNLGNTCYMNSIIQCLSNTIYIKDEFLQPVIKVNNNSKTKGKIALELKVIILQIWSDEFKSISVERFKSVVGRYREVFNGYDQQDSHEFLTVLLDWLHEDLNFPAPVSKKNLSYLLEGSSERAWYEFTMKNTSIIRKVFYGQHKSTVRCLTCGKESVTFEPFSTLSLSLPKSESTTDCTLTECLMKYLEGERICGWQCPNCREVRDAIKKLDITVLPPVLIIHFKRFSSDGVCKKRQMTVHYPLEHLDMEPFTLQMEHNRNKHYTLYAVSNHYGSMDSGHYTAYCKNLVDKGWYKYDDQDVSSIVNKSDILSNAAYIIFYVNNSN